MAVGALCLWRDRASWAKSAVAYGLMLALFSALICAVCFLPSASNDLVQRGDGSFNWKYIDTQYFHAMAASIKTGVSPPRTPGTVTAELLYHFGPYAPAAAISRLDGLDLGDAVARVTRGASIWALVLSCFGLGTLLSLKATGTKFGAIMSVAGLFFYGPLLLLIPFDGPRYSSGNLIGSLLFKTTNERMLAAGIPYDHLLSGHSVLHGLSAITAIMGLCLAEKARDSAITWRGVTLLALPALAVPVHPVAALYCLGVTGILLFWGRLREMQSWLPIVLMFGLFLGAWKIMGYSQSPDAAQVMLKEHPTCTMVDALNVVFDCAGISHCGLPLDLTILEGASFCPVPGQRRGTSGVYSPAQSQRRQREIRHLFFAMHVQHLCLLPDAFRMVARCRTSPNNRRLAQSCN